nr:MAG TPA: hypothetical protein [Caudoviricetes sp.]
MVELYNAEIFLPFKCSTIPREGIQGQGQQKKIVHELFRLLCFEFKCCTIPYFFDEMEEYEVQDIISNLEYYERPEWERTRFQTYCNLQKSSSKRISPQDLITFPWEKEESSTEQINGNSEPLTQSEIERLKEQAKIISQTLEDQ